MAHRVLILEDDESLRLVIAKALSRAGFEVRATASTDAALERLVRREVDVLLADVLLGRESFLDRLDEVTRVRPDIPVIIMSAQTTARTAIEAGKAGVFEYLPKPFDLNDMVAVIKRSLEDVGPSLPSSAAPGFGGLVGRSPAMQEAFRALGRLARTASPVLFTGPEGSGRAHCARVLVSETGVVGPVIEAGPARMRREGAGLLETAAGARSSFAAPTPGMMKLRTGFRKPLRIQGGIHRGSLPQPRLKSPGTCGQPCCLIWRSVVSSCPRSGNVEKTGRFCLRIFWLNNRRRAKWMKKSVNTSMRKSGRMRFWG